MNIAVNVCLGVLIIIYLIGIFIEKLFPTGWEDEYGFHKGTDPRCRHIVF